YEKISRKAFIKHFVYAFFYYINFRSYILQKETARHDRLCAAQDDPDALEALERAPKETKEPVLPKTPSKAQHESPSVAATPPPAEKPTKKARRPRKQASTSASSVVPLTVTNEASSDAATSSAACHESQKQLHPGLTDVKDIKVERDSKDLQLQKKQHHQLAEINSDMAVNVSIKLEQPSIKQEPIPVPTPEPDSRSTTPSGAVRPISQQLPSPVVPASPGKPYMEEPLHAASAPSPAAANLRSPSVTGHGAAVECLQHLTSMTSPQGSGAAVSVPPSPSGQVACPALPSTHNPLESHHIHQPQSQDEEVVVAVPSQPTTTLQTGVQVAQGEPCAAAVSSATPVASSMTPVGADTGSSAGGALSLPHGLSPPAGSCGPNLSASSSIIGAVSDAAGGGNSSSSSCSSVSSNATVVCGNGSGSSGSNAALPLHVHVLPTEGGVNLTGVRPASAGAASAGAATPVSSIADRDPEPALAALHRNGFPPSPASSSTSTETTSTGAPIAIAPVSSNANGSAANANISFAGYQPTEAKRLALAPEAFAGTGPSSHPHHHPLFSASPLAVPIGSQAQKQGSIPNNASTGGAVSSSVNPGPLGNATSDHPLLQGGACTNTSLSSLSQLSQSLQPTGKQATPIIEGTTSGSATVTGGLRHSVGGCPGSGPVPMSVASCVSSHYSQTPFIGAASAPSSAPSTSLPVSLSNVHSGGTSSTSTAPAASTHTTNTLTSLVFANKAWQPN
ncbi:hypothetical protein BIW11_10015, partial [Tropilaelaps mercedesae]